MNKNVKIFIRTTKSKFSDTVYYSHCSCVYVCKPRSKKILILRHGDKRIIVDDDLIFGDLVKEFLSADYYNYVKGISRIGISEMT